MLLAARHLALPLRKPAAPHIGRLCSRPYRLHSSSVGRTLCFAPIRPSRRDVEAVQRSNSKFPFVDEFKLFNGERYDSAKVIQGLDPLLTSSRRESITKVCCLTAAFHCIALHHVQGAHCYCVLSCSLVCFKSEPSSLAAGRRWQVFQCTPNCGR